MHPTVNDVRERLGDVLLLHEDGKIKKTTVSVLDGKYFALYFSAHWCPPCRNFTPKLIETYRRLNKSNKPFEVIFVSSDRSKDEFEEYFNQMPWLAIPHEHPHIKQDLAKLFSISGIPSLLIFRPDGELVNPNARTAIFTDPNGVNFPWDQPDLQERMKPDKMTVMVGFFIFLAVVFYLLNWLKDKTNFLGF